MEGPRGERDRDSGVSPSIELIVGLEYLRLKQKPLLEGYGHANIDKDTLARYSAALMIESAEFCNITPWKEWIDYGDGDGQRPIDYEAITEEFVDLLHFIGTWAVLLRLMGITLEDIATSFEKKNAKNQKRLTDLLAKRAEHS